MPSLEALRNAYPTEYGIALGGLIGLGSILIGYGVAV